MVNGFKMFTDNVQSGLGHLSIDLFDAAGGRIVQWDHGEHGEAFFNQIHRLDKSAAGKRGHICINMAASQVRVRTGAALVGDNILVHKRRSSLSRASPGRGDQK